jgi:hypothetical protein
MALIRDLNRGFSSPKQPPPQLREPRLSDDHAQRVANLDQKIYERGVAVSKDKLPPKRGRPAKRFDDRPQR